MGTAYSATGWQGEIRQAGIGDADTVASLAAVFSVSFEFSRRGSAPAIRPCSPRTARARCWP